MDVGESIFIRMIPYILTLALALGKNLDWMPLKEMN